MQSGYWIMSQFPEYTLNKDHMIHMMDFQPDIHTRAQGWCVNAWNTVSRWDLAAWMVPCDVPHGNYMARCAPSLCAHFPRFNIDMRHKTQLEWFALRLRSNVWASSISCQNQTVYAVTATATCARVYVSVCVCVCKQKKALQMTEMKNTFV